MPTATAEIKRDIRLSFKQNDDGRADGDFPLQYGVHLTGATGGLSDIVTVYNAIPGLGSTDTLGGRTFMLIEKTPRRVTRDYWEIDSVWSTRSKPTESNETSNASPESWSPKWLGSGIERIAKAARKDIEGNEIRLSNGQTYSDPVIANLNILVTRYRKYVPVAAADATILAHCDKLNSLAYRGQPKHTWLCSASASPVVVNGFNVAELTYELRFNPLTWVEERLQHGSKYINPANTAETLLFRTEPEKDPTTGDLLENGQPNLTGTPVYRKHRVNGEMNYAVLGF